MISPSTYLPSKNKKHKLGFSLILLFCLSNILFFEPLIIDIKYLYYLYYVTLLLSFIIILLSKREFKYFPFTSAIFLIIIAEIISIFVCSNSWGQSFGDSLLGTLPYMGYILFFLLFRLNIQTIDAEKILIILGVIYIIVFGTSFLIYPQEIFNSNPNLHGLDRGFQRITIKGVGFLFLFSFFSLEKYIINRKFVWLFIYLITILFIIMTLTRTYIVVSILISLIFFFKNINSNGKVALIIFTCITFYLITKMEFYKNLTEQTVSQSNDLEDDIRMQSLNYYLYNFSPDVVTKIFGNGISYKDSQYSQKVNYLEKDLGLYVADIGYIGLYIKFGIISILGYLLFIYKAFKMKTPEGFLYCKYFLLFIFIISIIIDAPFNSSFIPSIMLAAYILASNFKNNRKINNFQVHR